MLLPNELMDSDYEWLRVLIIAQVSIPDLAAHSLANPASIIRVQRLPEPLHIEV
jgi:hypothetical protein